MFRNLPVYAPNEASLVKLGESMIQDIEHGELDKPLGEDDDDENTAQLDGQLRLPAGYTYFGQFVDHDITFDPVSSLMRQDDPDALVDYRTPRFDLDNLYGRGPSDQPYLYQPDGLHLTLGKPVSEDPRTAGLDLQRVETGRAIIGDPRNDENLIVSQLQSTFLRFHNTVLDQVGAANPNLGKEDVFKLTQQTVRWHYQWVVIHDFLRRLVGQNLIRGLRMGLPSGQDVARAMGIEPLTDEELLGGLTLDEETKKDLEGMRPSGSMSSRRLKSEPESAHPRPGRRAHRRGGTRRTARGGPTLLPQRPTQLATNSARRDSWHVHAQRPRQHRDTGT